jgi:CelD/BcsL family acetyltransferase involved in cellulose biosynthesis
MKAELAANFEDIGRERWNALVSQNATNTVFQTYEWNAAWWKIFGQGRELFLICVRDNDQIVGIAPLIIDLFKPGKKILRFVGDGASDYSDFIYMGGPEDILGIILEFIKNQSRRWDEIIFNQVPLDSPSLKRLEGGCKKERLYFLNMGGAECPTLIMAGHEDFVEQVRSKKSLIRHQKFFIKKGGYQVFHLSNKSDIDGYVPLFFDQHIQRWNGTSQFINENERQFYWELVSQGAEAGWLVFTVVLSCGSPIAFHFGFSYNKKFIWYKPSFEISLSKYSPGEVLLKELLDFAVSRQLEEFDFTVGDEAFKLRFSNKVKRNVSLRFFKNRVDYLIVKTLETSKVLMKDHRMTRPVFDFLKRIKKSRRTENVAD